jgi:GMP synthase (glutamine-hydrolysing)
MYRVGIMRILVVDLGSQWTHRILRTLKYIGVDSEIISCKTPLKKIDADGLVLSGGAIRIGLGEVKELKEVSNYIDKFNKPILGICAGHQFIGMHFGGKAQPSEKPEYGKVELFVDEEDELFKGLPKKFIVWASHNDEVVDVPHFKVLAHSKDCSNHAMKHESKPIYGCIFHPEVEHTEYGEKIYKNFAAVCSNF